MPDLLRPWDAILRLENDPRGVPATLLAGGFRGERENCARCPVALYLLAATGVREVDVNEVEIHFFPHGYDMASDVEYELHNTPPFIERFVRRFDAGSEPELDVDEPEVFSAWEGVY